MVITITDKKDGSRQTQRLDLETELKAQTGSRERTRNRESLSNSQRLLPVTYFLQQDHTSESYSNRAIHLGSSIQIHKGVEGRHASTVPMLSGC